MFPLNRSARSDFFCLPCQLSLDKRKEILYTRPQIEQKRSQGDEMKITAAQNIATGDTVYLPIGKRTVKLVTGRDRKQIRFRFDDDQIRAFNLAQILKISVPAQAICPKPNQIVRTCLTSGRISIVDQYNLRHFGDLSDAFQVISKKGYRGRIYREKVGDIARAELHRGATIFTATAIYTMPVSTFRGTNK